MMDTHGTPHDSKSTNSSDEEIEITHQQAFVDQAKVFEDMKMLLTTQQAALKHNLDVLQTKATRVIKPKVNKRNVADSTEKKSQDNMNEMNTTTTMNEMNTTTTMNEMNTTTTMIMSDRQSDNNVVIDSERQWSHPSAPTAMSGKSREDIQICPICALEFDNPEHPEALEEHVAGHWCSTDHN